MDKSKSKRLVQKLTADDLRHLVECIEHAFTKPHHELTELVPKLIDGHHHIADEKGARIKAAIKQFDNDDLAWLAEHAEALIPD